jgi:hypothetical protein
MATVPRKITSWEGNHAGQDPHARSDERLMKHSLALPSTFRIRRGTTGLYYDGAENLFDEFQGVVAALEGAGRAAAGCDGYPKFT